MLGGVYHPLESCSSQDSMASAGAGMRRSYGAGVDAVWQSDFGVPLFVLGVIASAIAVRVSLRRSFRCPHSIE
jgi:hypothetical protein